MILANAADLMKYIPVQNTFASIWDKFAPFIEKAANSYTVKHVGQLHKLLENAESGDEDSIRNQAREHLRSALANFAFFMYLPFYQVTLDSSGASVPVNGNKKTPEWWQTADMRRELLRSGHESLDLLLEILEQNPSEFEEYTSKYSTVYRELLVKNSGEFNRYYNIFNSRQTYMALMPTIRQVETQYLRNFITPEFLQELKDFDETDSEAEDQSKLVLVKQYLQGAVVAFTIAKIYNEGYFHFDASGLKLKFDVLPNEKVTAIDYGKQADQMQRAIRAKIDDGTNLIKLAKEIIAEHFSENLSTKTSTTTTTIGTGGIIGI